MRLVMQITKQNATIWNPTYTITEGDGPWPVFDHNGEQVGYVERQPEPTDGHLRDPQFCPVSGRALATPPNLCAQLGEHSRTAVSRLSVYSGVHQTSQRHLGH